MRADLTMGPLALGGLTTLVTVFLAAQTTGLIAVGIGLAGALAFGGWAAARLGGGVTGDVYGATVELPEVLVLLAGVALG